MYVNVQVHRITLASVVPVLLIAIVVCLIIDLMNCTLRNPARHLARSWPSFRMSASATPQATMETPIK
ncbi:MAG TPA: hypothetical protein VF928_16755 [Usitatibacteraceae bacterium]